jgi:hypothetical protein
MLFRSIPERDHYQRGLIAAEEALNAQFEGDRGNALRWTKSGCACSRRINLNPIHGGAASKVQKQS